MTQLDWEILIGASAQIGALIWALSGMKSDLKNLAGWVSKIDRRSEDTATVQAEMRGHLSTLPCGSCPTPERY